MHVSWKIGNTNHGSCLMGWLSLDSCKIRRLLYISCTRFFLHHVCWVVPLSVVVPRATHDSVHDKHVVQKQTASYSVHCVTELVQQNRPVQPLPHSLEDTKCPFNVLPACLLPSCVLLAA
jgi:hypothetical protein